MDDGGSTSMTIRCRSCLRAANFERCLLTPGIPTLPFGVSKHNAVDAVTEASEWKLNDKGKGL